MKKNNVRKIDILPRLRKELPYLRDKDGVRRMALYGSYARGAAGAESDVDLLVDLSRPLGFEFVGLADHLENMLARRVDIATFATLKHSLDTPRRRTVALTIQRTLVNV